LCRQKNSSAALSVFSEVGTHLKQDGAHVAPPIPIQLRSHPCMSYHGASNWPPVWMWMGRGENKYPKGEVGILSKIWFSRIQPGSRFVLHMESEGSDYTGVLLFDDPWFCREVFKLLSNNLSRSLKEIGDLNMAYTF